MSVAEDMAVMNGKAASKPAAGSPSPEDVRRAVERGKYP